MSYETEISLISSLHLEFSKFAKIFVFTSLCPTDDVKKQREYEMLIILVALFTNKFSTDGLIVNIKQIYTA